MEFTSPSPEDLEPLSFTPDQQAQVRDAVKKIQQHLAMLPWHFDHDGVSRFVADSAMSVTEFEISKLGKLLGVETEAAAKIEERHGNTRRANMRVRELEELLGKGQTPHAIQPALKGMCDQLNGWWALEGFGHISEISFGAYNLKAQFSCRFFGVKPHIDTPEPVSSKERFKLWLTGLPDRGFMLLEDDGDKGVMDCPDSRQALVKLFAGRLSSATISQFISRESRNGSQLTGVEVFIRDITQILELPVPPKDAEELG